MTQPRPESALLILGHGSTENPDSSAPCWQHRDTIARMGLFGSVHCAFWKEEPGFRQVWPMIEEEEVYVVPNFISEGYFTREVIPRELQLSGRTTVTERHRIHYCDPVGLDSRMTELLLQRAEDMLEPGMHREECALLIVGHGTKLNASSKASIEKQVTSIRERERSSDTAFADVLATFMEEPPFISDWRELTSAPNVIVVPFFIADALHSYQDIPVLLGLEPSPTEPASRREIFRHNPHSIEGRNLFYSSAIGTDPAMVEVILDQVTTFDEHYR